MNAVIKVEVDGKVMVEIPIELAATDSVEFSMLPEWTKAELIRQALYCPPSAEIG